MFICNRGIRLFVKMTQQTFSKFSLYCIVVRMTIDFRIRRLHGIELLIEIDRTKQKQRAVFEHFISVRFMKMTTFIELECESILGYHTMLNLCNR